MYVQDISYNEKLINNKDRSTKLKSILHTVSLTILLFLLTYASRDGCLGALEIQEIFLTALRLFTVPYFSQDCQDRALCIAGCNLGFKCYESSLAMSVKQGTVNSLHGPLCTPMHEGERAGTHHPDKTVERHREEKVGHHTERTQTLKKKKLMPMRCSTKSLNTTTQTGPRAVYSPRQKQLGHFHQTPIFFPSHLSPLPPNIVYRS